MISAIGGMAGVGKTALAVHWAHQVAGKFPDGQLYVNLRGFGPSGDPLAPDRAVRGFLDALGVPAERIPANLEARTGLYRSLLASKQMLLVLDNARDEEQVRPLLPASPGCLVVVTSRIQLTGLMTAEGARSVTLDVLSDDLLRAYAAHQCQALDSERDRRAALTRLFDHYLAAAGTAMDKLMPVAWDRWPPIPSHAVPLLPALDTPHAARAWLDAERATLVAVARYTAARGWPSHTTRLSVVLYRYYLDVGAHYPDGLAVHTHALHAARQSGDRTGQADALSSRGAVYAVHGRYPQAASQFRQALAIYQQLGDRRGQARVLSNLGCVLWDRARCQESADHCRHALALHRAVGDQFGQAVALSNLGGMLCRMGSYEQAGGHHRQALAIFREIGYRNGEARALANLGAVLHGQGQYQEAAGYLGRALAMFRDLGNRDGEADVLNDLGATLRGQGEPGQAVNRHRQALAIFREMSDKNREAEALNGLGEALTALGQTAQARAQHHDALALASQLGNRRLQARSHDGLAHTCHAAGDLNQARQHWERAMALYSAF